MTQTHPRIVVVMPAYNESEGIPGFIEEVTAALAPLAEDVRVFVADDRSTDDTAAVLAAMPGVVVETQAHNRGHGPAALAAYRLGLAADPDVLVHVDGDGQFYGADIARVVQALDSTGADVVHGVRTGRTDAWYRRVLTFCVRLLVAAAAGKAIPDVNTPLRAYRPMAASALVSALPGDVQVPHVHFSFAEARGGFDVRYAKVASIPRRGASDTGTMWGKATRLLPPKRLRALMGDALIELWRLSLRPGAPLRSLTRPARVEADR
ncbi:glycosyltransferase family 2 protein [Microbacterium stercoris]|uniref:Glycosyltransferase family 2 protein n=1 Tax=Microbacterium stercoris TaxID=2820289 RepID=A0A939QR49_9MICO|nr:glycosyltransferase family 2 protein [Microbacterium stercoris]MBO3663518.1 glycosyltransferase family 2 protein [Microbacterium stercoris]